ncbi:hypothetical protein VTJ83DRAFT_1379 [Remersonia thermophila]|uniref:Uncharacterized protein n=1 Tax=Remersonia thermophila TaxID=72144 RepID=A0ABR4DNU8_9PEZI
MSILPAEVGMVVCGFIWCIGNKVGSGLLKTVRQTSFSPKSSGCPEYAITNRPWNDQSSHPGEGLKTIRQETPRTVHDIMKSEAGKT